MIPILFKKTCNWRFFDSEFRKNAAITCSLILNFPKDQNQFSSKKLELEVIKKIR
jgi:hypothetical protein